MHGEIPQQETANLRRELVTTSCNDTTYMHDIYVVDPVQHFPRAHCLMRRSFALHSLEHMAVAVTVTRSLLRLSGDTSDTALWVVDFSFF